MTGTNPEQTDTVAPLDTHAARWDRGGCGMRIDGEVFCGDLDASGQLLLCEPCYVEGADSGREEEPPGRTAVVPLSDAEVADLRDWTDSHRLTAQSDAILRLCATVDMLQHKLATARRQRDHARATLQRHLDEIPYETEIELAQSVKDLMRELSEARRQRDERPAGRVLASVETKEIPGPVAGPLPDMSVCDAVLATPPGTEVAVVVVDGDHSGEGE